MDNNEKLALDLGSTAAGQKDIAGEIKSLRARLSELERRLAPAIREKIPTGTLTVLITRVGSERIAFLQRGIEEIVPMARLTEVPESAEWIAGILNLRERMVAVIDVQARLRRTARRQELSDLILICRLEERVIGLIVQELLEIKTVANSEIHPAPTDVPFVRHLMGTLQSDGLPVLLISLNTLVETSDVPSTSL
jgi:purine-binding chemotaxis protein CheW